MKMEARITEANNQDIQNKQAFVIHRLFIRSLSFEVPHSPKTVNYAIDHTSSNQCVTAKDH